MTAQIMEIIKIDGRDLLMATEPLRSHLCTLDDGINIAPESSACWRGYQGTWEIIEDKLYLIDINARAIVSEKYEEVGLSYFFPNRDKVFASWFSGEIRIPNGDLLRYEHMGYMSIYEEDIFLTIENGVLIKKKIKNNS